MLHDNGSRENMLPAGHDIYKSTTSILLSIIINDGNGSVVRSFMDPSVVTRICLAENSCDVSKCKVITVEDLVDYANMKTPDAKSMTVTDPYMLTTTERFDGMVWFGHNPHFGWATFSKSSFQDIPSVKLKEARAYPGKVVTLGGGHRDITQDLDTWFSSSVNISSPRVNHIFHRGKMGNDDRCCVWLSTCMLVDLQCREVALEMVQMMNRNVSQMECMSLLGKLRETPHQEEFYQYI